MKLTSLSEPIWRTKHALLRTHTNKHVIQGRHAISEGEELECVSCPRQVLWVFWDSVLCSRANLCSAVFWHLNHFTMFLSRNWVLNQNLSSFQPNQSNSFTSLWQLIAGPYLTIWELLKGTEAVPWVCPHTNTPTQTHHPRLVYEKALTKGKRCLGSFENEFATADVIKCKFSIVSYISNITVWVESMSDYI